MCEYFSASLAFGVIIKGVGPSGGEYVHERDVSTALDSTTPKTLWCLCTMKKKKCDYVSAKELIYSLICHGGLIMDKNGNSRGFSWIFCSVAVNAIPLEELVHFQLISVDHKRRRKTLKEQLNLLSILYRFAIYLYINNFVLFSVFKQNTVWVYS